MRKKIPGDVISKLRNAQSADELIEIAKAEGIEIEPDDAERGFDELKKSSKRLDDELGHDVDEKDIVISRRACPHCGAHLHTVKGHFHWKYYRCHNCGYGRIRYK